MFEYSKLLVYVKKRMIFKINNENKKINNEYNPKSGFMGHPHFLKMCKRGLKVCVAELVDVKVTDDCKCPSGDSIAQRSAPRQSSHGDRSNFAAYGGSVITIVDHQSPTSDKSCNQNPAEMKIILS